MYSHFPIVPHYVNHCTRIRTSTHPFHFKETEGQHNIDNYISLIYHKWYKNHENKKEKDYKMHYVPYISVKFYVTEICLTINQKQKQ
jgi:hypothetical protein